MKLRFCGVFSFSKPQIAVAPQTSVRLETDVAAPFASHEVATAYSLGR